MNHPDTWTDAQIIEGFKGDTSMRQSALRALYLRSGLREKAIALVVKTGGTAEEALDYFQDAIIIADRQLREGIFKSKSSLSTWILAIVKNLSWAQRQKSIRRSGIEIPEVEPVPMYTPEQMMLQQERIGALDQALSQIGEVCKKLLQLYALRYSMEEIAREMQFEDAERAKDRTRDCRNKLSKAIRQHPLFNELLNPK